MPVVIVQVVIAGSGVVTRLEFRSDEHNALFEPAILDAFRSRRFVLLENHDAVGTTHLKADAQSRTSCGLSSAVAVHQ
jgi:hypothetical protein